MVDLLSSLGDRLNIKPFYISFVVSPLVSNASELITAIVFAGESAPVLAQLMASRALSAAAVPSCVCEGGG